MGRIKKALGLGILTLALLTICIAGTPQYQTLSTGTSTIAAGDTTYVTISSVNLSGDSVGLMMDFNCDSLSGYVQYRCITPNGNSNYSSFTGSPTFTTYDINSGQKAVFTGSLPRNAGCATAQYYIMLINDKASQQVVTYTFYNVLWR